MNTRTEQEGESQRTINHMRETNLLQIDRSIELLDSLKETNDPDIRRHILNVTKKNIAHPEIFEKWCAILSEKWSQPFRIEMVVILNYSISTGIVFYGWHKHLSGQMKILFSMVKEEPCRPEVLKLLQYLVMAAPDSNDWLNLLSLAPHRKERDVILWHLFALRHRWSGSDVFFAKMLKSESTTIDEIWRAAVVVFLLPKNKLPLKDQLRMLKPVEPEGLRYAIVTHWNDHFQNPNKKIIDAASRLLQNDSSKRIRAMAANYLMKCISADPSLLSLLVEVFISAAEPDWQSILQTYLTSFVADPTWSQKLVADLLKAITSSANEETTLRCICILEPLLSDTRNTGKEVFEGFCHILQKNPATKVYRHLLSALREAINIHPDLATFLAEAYSKVSSETIRGDLIVLLTETNTKSGSIEKWLDLEAMNILHARAPFLRAAGLFYLTKLALTPETQEKMCSGIHLLNDVDISEDLRSEYGYKLSRVIAMDQESLEKLEKTLAVMKESSNFRNPKPDLLKLAERLKNSNKTAESINWKNLLERVQNKKSLEGVTAQAYLHFESDPEKATEVLKAMLLHSEARYQPLGEKTDIISFLLAKNKIDSEVAAFSFEQLIYAPAQHREMNYYLMVLKNHKSISKEGQQLWHVFERQNNLKYLNPVLLQEVFELAFGSGESFFRQMKERLQKKQTALSLQPYLDFLRNNTSWQHAKRTIEFFEELLNRSPHLEENGIRDIVNSLRVEVGLDQLRTNLKIERHKKKGLLDD